MNITVVIQPTFTPPPPPPVVVITVSLDTAAKLKALVGRTSGNVFNELFNALNDVADLPRLRMQTTNHFPTNRGGPGTIDLQHGYIFVPD